MQLTRTLLLRKNTRTPPKAIARRRSIGRAPRRNGAFPGRKAAAPMTDAQQLKLIGHPQKSRRMPHPSAHPGLRGEAGHLLA